MKKKTRPLSCSVHIGCFRIQNNRPFSWIQETDTHYWTPGVRDDGFEEYVRFFECAVLPDFMLMNDNANPQIVTIIVTISDERDGS